MRIRSISPRGPAGRVPYAGNRFVYAIAPVLSVTPISAVTTYDGTVPIIGIAITGLLAGDSLAQAVSGAPAVSGAGSNAGGYGLTAANGSLYSDYDYGFAFGTRSFTV